MHKKYKLGLDSVSWFHEKHRLASENKSQDRFFVFIILHSCNVITGLAIKNKHNDKCVYDCVCTEAVIHTSVLREADGQRAVSNLLLKQVLLVEEQDDGRLCEPLVVADWVKELHAFMHPVLGGPGTNAEIKRLLENTTRPHKGNEFTETSALLPVLFIFLGLDSNVKFSNCFLSVYSPSPHPQLGPDHKHSWLHRRWWLWLPQSSGSTSSFLTAGLQHQTSCTNKRSVNIFLWGGWDSAMKETFLGLST